jgi:hypothetical protein
MYSCQAKTVSNYHYRLCFTVNHCASGILLRLFTVEPTKRTVGKSHPAGYLLKMIIAERKQNGSAHYGRNSHNEYCVRTDWRISNGRINRRKSEGDKQTEVFPCGPKMLLGRCAFISPEWELRYQRHQYIEKTKHTEHIDTEVP